MPFTMGGFLRTTEGAARHLPCGPFAFVEAEHRPGGGGPRLWRDLTVALEVSLARNFYGAGA